jgi:hypothetical protein
MEDQAPRGHCEDCRYWGIRVPAWNTYSLKTCGAAPFVYGYDLQAVLAVPAAVAVENHTGWGLLTGPRFGCVHWAAPGEEAIPHAETPPAV